MVAASKLKLDGPTTLQAAFEACSYRVPEYRCTTFQLLVEESLLFTAAVKFLSCIVQEVKKGTIQQEDAFKRVYGLADQLRRIICTNAVLAPLTFTEQGKLYAKSAKTLAQVAHHPATEDPPRLVPCIH